MCSTTPVFCCIHSTSAINSVQQMVSKWHWFCKKTLHEGILAETGRHITGIRNIPNWQGVLCKMAVHMVVTDPTVCLAPSRHLPRKGRRGKMQRHGWETNHDPQGSSPGFVYLIFKMVHSYQICFILSNNTEVILNIVKCDDYGGSPHPCWVGLPDIILTDPLG